MIFNAKKTNHRCRLFACAIYGYCAHVRWRDFDYIQRSSIVCVAGLGVLGDILVRYVLFHSRLDHNF